MSNPELNPSAKTPAKPAAPTSSAADLASIPAMDSGHTQPNFPGYDHGEVAGIPVVKSTNALTPGYRDGDRISIADATEGERGGNN